MNKYKNEKLNIEISYANEWKVMENSNYVALYFNDILTVKAYDNSTVIAYDNSTVEAYDNSTVIAYDNSTVEAYDNSTVIAYSNSTVRAYEFSCVCIESIKSIVKTFNHYGAIIEQEFKVKKKMVVYKKLRDELIAELELVRGQVFQSENHSKCRTDRAKVLRITNKDGSETYQKGYSQHNKNFKYIVGETVSAKYDETIEECSTGIHFFLARESAVNY